MRKELFSVILGLTLATATGSASAAFIDFIEGPLETDPITVITDLVLTGPLVVTSETASVVALHHPGISPAPVIPGSRSAGLFEPGFTDLLSDFVLFTAGDVRTDPVFGAAQDLHIEFFSIDTPISLLPAGFPFSGGVTEDGTLQDLSGFLGTLPEGVIVRALSRPGEVPEPATLLLVASGLLGLGVARRLTRVSPR